MKLVAFEELPLKGTRERTRRPVPATRAERLACSSERFLDTTAAKRAASDQTEIENYRNEQHHKFRCIGN